VQRGAPGAGLIRIGPAREPEDGHGRVPAVDRDEQRRGIGVGREQPVRVGVAADAAGRRLVHVGAAIEEQARDRGIALLRREEARREPVRRSRPHVGAGRDERPDHVEMALRHRAHEGVCPAAVSAGVIRAGREQPLWRMPGILARERDSCRPRRAGAPRRRRARRWPGAHSVLRAYRPVAGARLGNWSGLSVKTPSTPSSYR
jgi:hypothetical protein